jgi:hypothetical protein
VLLHPHLRIQATGGHDVYKNVIGIQLKRVLVNASISNEIAIDIVCPNLPYRACINNSRRHHILTRMVINDGYNDYEPSMYYENTFYPISLDHLDVHIRKSDDCSIIDSILSVTLEFKLDIIKDRSILE